VLDDVGVFVGTFVEVETVFEGDGFTLFQIKGALADFEVFFAERIGGDEAVVTGMPGGGVARVGGVVEDGDADGFAVYWPPVVDPFGDLAPDGFSGDAFAVDGGTFGNGTFQAKCGMGANGHAAFLGFDEGDVTMRGMDGDFVIDVAAAFGGAEANFGGVGADSFVVLQPGTVADDHSFLTIDFGFHDFVASDTGTFVATPEVGSIDGVTVVQRLVVRVVGGFTFNAFLHGMVPGHGNAVRSDDRIKNGFGFVAVEILGEEFGADVHGDFLVFLVVLNGE